MDTQIPKSLGSLSDPTRYTEAIQLGKHSPKILLPMLQKMLLIRAAEEQIGDMVSAGKVACPCHLGIGQEAVAVGVSHNLLITDFIFGGHRSHSHFLAIGGSLFSLFAEVLGKDTGASKGMGGSMHLYDNSKGFLGSIPIVAATIPLAVGAALAAQKKGSDSIAVCYFGDGASEEGVFHESLNFASFFKLPVLFVCENNLFASHLHIAQRQPACSISRFAAAHCIPYRVVDGNDLVALIDSSQQLIEETRNKKGPVFLEAVTYRWRGHVGPREDLDVGVKRNEDLHLWKKRDPIHRLYEALKKTNSFNETDFANLKQEISFLVAKEWQRAENAPYPPLSATLNRVYSKD